MQTAALYIRVSTSYQEELSPDAQKRLLIEYAEKNNLLVSEQYIFIENGISGKKADKRPEFMKMIGLAKNKDHPFDVILVWKYSRFARNQEESIVYKSLLKKNGIDVVSVSEPLIDGPFGSLIERIIEWMDEYYSIRLAGEVTRGMTEKALRGGYQSSPGLGYKIEHKGELPVIVPEEAEIIKTIFDKYVNENLSAFQITRYLNALGLKTKNKNDFERRSIEYILQNPLYKGYIRWNRSENVTNIIKDESEWIVVKGEHEPIISESIFEQAQVRFKMDYTPRKARPSVEYRHWLSGLMKCSNCGRTLSASARVGIQYAYFQCNGYSKGKCTVSHSVSDSKLTPVIISKLAEIIETEKFDYKVVRQENKSDVSLLQQQLKKLASRGIRIREAYIGGIDSIEEYKHNKDILSREKESITKQLEKINYKSNIDYRKDMLNQMKSVYNIIIDSKKSPGEKNMALKTVVEKIIYNKSEESLDIILHYKVTSNSMEIS